MQASVLPFRSAQSNVIASSHAWLKMKMNTFEILSFSCVSYILVAEYSYWLVATESGGTGLELMAECSDGENWPRMI